jgi:hypothetical protein
MDGFTNLPWAGFLLSHLSFHTFFNQVPVTGFTLRLRITPQVSTIMTPNSGLGWRPVKLSQEDNFRHPISLDFQ